MIYVEEFKEEDALKLKNWGSHDDLRFVQYDFARFSEDRTFKIWFEIKNKENRKLFAIKEDEDVRGFISLRKINSLTKSAELGISIDPNYLSMGIGKLALSQFLDIYFMDMDMKKLSLRVSEFNKRAINLYSSVGFEYISSKLSVFENQMDNFELILYYDDFKMVEDSLYTESRKYRMTKKDYLLLSSNNIITDKNNNVKTINASKFHMTIKDL